MKMDYDEIWGIAYSRINDFFSLQSDVSKTDEHLFQYKAATIELEELPDRWNFSMRIAQTRVKITGGPDADEIHYRFYMRFLSAGG